MGETLKTCLIQTSSSDNEISNQNQLLSVMDSVLVEKPDLVVLPENCFIVTTANNRKSFRLDDSFFNPFQQWSKQNKIGILCGGVPIDEKNKIYNSILFFDPENGLRNIYSKMHLFDVELGDLTFKESDFCTPGDKAVVIDYKGWKVGMSICYDLRFAELYIDLVKQGAEIIIIPACFTVPTGRAHWSTLIRARAIETQCYVLAPAQAGNHKNNQDQTIRESWGESMVVDPWGKVIARSASYDELQNNIDPKRDSAVLITELKRQELLSVRDKIPMKNHRVYQVSLKK